MLFRQNFLNLGVGAAMCLIAAPSFASDELPRFDVEVHCNEVAEFAGGSEQMYGFCFDQEQVAYNSVKAVWGALNETIQSHCQSVAEFSGNSYEMLDFCIKEELKAQGENAGKVFKY